MLFLHATPSMNCIIRTADTQRDATVWVNIFNAARHVILLVLYDGLMGDGLRQCKCARGTRNIGSVAIRRISLFFLEIDSVIKLETIFIFAKEIFTLIRIWWSSSIGLWVTGTRSGQCRETLKVINKNAQNTVDVDLDACACQLPY